MFAQMTTAYSGVHGGSRTIPGRFGARASKTGQALLSESHREHVSAEGAVREYDREGRVLREFPARPTPVAAVRLENGNTLITADGAVAEYAPDGLAVWELTRNDIPDVQIGALAGVTRLRNGNTIVCNWDTRDTDERVGAHLFEVTEDKLVVWMVTGTHVGRVAQCRLLSDNTTKPRPGWTGPSGQRP